MSGFPNPGPGLPVGIRGLTGAQAGTRYVGATSSGAPVSGTFRVGDFVIDLTGTEWICTVAGSPGTWVEVISSSATSVFTQGTLAARPAAGTAGRLYRATDSPRGLWQDDGTSWWPVGAVTVRAAAAMSQVAAPTVALNLDATPAQVDAGTHVYALVPVTALGRSIIGATSATLTNDATHTSNTVTVPALSGAITSYDIIRTKAGVTAPTIGQWFLVAAAQAPGPYTDIIADAALTAITAGTDTTPQNDTELLWTVAANEVWAVRAIIQWTMANGTGTAASADVKTGWSSPAGAAGNWGATSLGFGATATGGTPTSLAAISTAVGFGGLNGTFGQVYEGVFVVASTAGTINFQWAKNAADTATISRLANSYLTLNRLA